MGAEKDDCAVCGDRNVCPYVCDHCGAPVCGPCAPENVAVTCGEACQRAIEEGPL